MANSDNSNSNREATISEIITYKYKGDAYRRADVQVYPKKKYGQKMFKNIFFLDLTYSAIYLDYYKFI